MAGATKSSEARTLTERSGCGECMYVQIVCDRYDVVS